jgi:iron complex outermembrane receptor protein
MTFEKANSIDHCPAMHPVKNRIGALYALLTVSALGSGAALAQQTTAAASSDESAGISEVVVTARRVTEKIQDIPLSITSISADTLEKVGATNLRDILNQTPGVVLIGTATEALENPEIRGQYDFNYSSFTDGQPNVATFLDGIYLQNPSALSISLVNLERVEVISGPVSALYGRTGFAGAINYVDKLPTDEFHADGIARFEQYFQDLYQGTVSGAIVPGLLRASVSYSYDYARGDYQDGTNGNWIGGHLKNDMKLIVDFTPTDKLDINGGVYYGSDHFSQDPLVFAANGYNCAGSFVSPGVTDNLQCGKFIAAPIQVASIPPQSGDSGNNRVVTLSHLKANYDLDFADLSYLAGYNNVIQRSYEDFAALDTGLIFPLYNATTNLPTGTTVGAFELFGSDDRTQDWSQELRLTSKQNQPLRWSFGADFFKSSLYTTTLAGIDGQNIPAGDTINSPGNFGSAQGFVTTYGEPSPTKVTLVRVGDKQYSAFGSLEYDPIQVVTIGAEYRYTRDEQHEDIVYNNFAGGTLNPYPFGPIAPEHFDYGNYRAYVKYKFTPDTLAYVSVANGTKPGGFNTQSTGGPNQTYGPEKNTTYEIGVKSTFLDHKVQINADVYHIDSTGLQVYFPEGDGLHFVIGNVGGTTNTGAEFSVQVVPVTHLQLGLAVAYTDPKFTSGSYDASNAGYCLQIPSCAGRVVQLAPGFKGVNVQGLELPDVSKLTANFSIDYSQPLTPGIDGFVHADYRYADKQYESVTLFNNAFTGATDIVNLKIGAKRGQFTADLFVKNLLNDQTPLDVARATEFVNFSGNFEFTASLPPPRVFGGEIAFHF